MRYVVCIVLIGLLLPTKIAAEPNFPILTGHVVDEADLISAGREAELVRLLEKTERDDWEQ